MQEGQFMEKNLWNREEQTLFEREGIAYEMRGDFAYPILGKSDAATIMNIGKYGRKWMMLLWEIDRHAYHKYLLSGELTVRAMEFNEQAVEMEEEMVRQYVNHFPYTDRNSSVEILRANYQATFFADEVITNDARVSIEYEKQCRFEEALAAAERQ